MERVDEGGCGMTITQIIRSYLPQFCWQTRYEIVTFVEQINEDASIDCIGAAINKLKKRGEIESRKAHTKQNRRRGKHYLEYRRAQ